MSDDSLSPGWGCALIAAAWIIGIPLGALAISLTWNWFVVPWLNLPTMGIATAIGVRMFVSAVWTPLPPKPDPSQSASDQIIQASGALLITPVATIAIAAAWHFIAG